MTRVLVCGGRYYDDRAALWSFLDRCHAVAPITCLIDGECHLGGADLIAHEWAVDRGVPTERYPVDCYIDGPWPSAGNRRNGRMLSDGAPDVVLATEGGSGTADMCRRARAAGMPVVRVP